MSYRVVHVWISCPCTIYLCQYLLWVSIYSFVLSMKYEWDRIKQGHMKTRQTDIHTFLTLMSAAAWVVPAHHRHNISKHDPTHKSRTRKEYMYHQAAALLHTSGRTIPTSHSSQQSKKEYHIAEFENNYRQIAWSQPNGLLTPICTYKGFQFNEQVPTPTLHLYATPFIYYTIQNTPSWVYF